MNISIIGPERSGKSSLASFIAKKIHAGRPIFFNGEGRSEFPHITLEQLPHEEDYVTIFDDFIATMDSVDIHGRHKDLKSPFVRHRHTNRIHIGIFHSWEDTIKFFLRQSRFIYVSQKIDFDSYRKNPLIKNRTPEVIGAKKFMFNKFKRY